MWSNVALSGVSRFLSVGDIKRVLGTCPGRGAARHDRTARPKAVMR